MAQYGVIWGSGGCVGAVLLCVAYLCVYILRRSLCTYVVGVYLCRVSVICLYMCICSVCGVCLYVCLASVYVCVCKVLCACMYVGFV